MADDIEIKDGKLYGGWRAPTNLLRASTDSIHDDGVAQTVGMRGGTIQGTRQSPGRRSRPSVARPR